MSLIAMVEKEQAIERIDATLPKFSLALVTRLAELLEEAATGCDDSPPLRFVSDESNHDT